MSDIKKITKKIIEFRDERDWKQFHTPKDLAISLSLEASEVLEHFLWRDKEESKKHLKNNKDDIADELADVFINVLLISYDFNIDIIKASESKIKKIIKKYPVEKSRGRYTKYNKL